MYFYEIAYLIVIKLEISLYIINIGWSLSVVPCGYRPCNVIKLHDIWIREMSILMLDTGVEEVFIQTVKFSFPFHEGQ